MSEGVPQQPTYFTLGEAAKQVQVSKPTLSKAVKDGRLSAEKQPDGSYRIQPAELFRVYPQRNGSTGTNFDERETGNDNRLVSGELSRLREQLALLSAERDRERQQLTDQIEDLRHRLDAEAEARRVEGEERRKLTAILTDQSARPAASPKPQHPEPRGLRGFLHRLTG
jgi:excisionase family DNA binding protein